MKAFAVMAEDTNVFVLNEVISCILMREPESAPEVLGRVLERYPMASSVAMGNGLSRNVVPNYEALRRVLLSLRGMGAKARPALAGIRRLTEFTNVVLESAAWNTLLIVAPDTEAEAVNAITRLLKDNFATASYYTMITDIRELGIGGVFFAPVLRAQLDLEKDPNGRFRIWEALIAISPESGAWVRDALEVDLLATDPELRQLAAVTLGGLGVQAKASLPALETLKNDPEEMVRRAAQNAIFQILRAGLQPRQK